MDTARGREWTEIQADVGFTRCLRSDASTSFLRFVLLPGTRVLLNMKRMPAAVLWWPNVWMSV